MLRLLRLLLLLLPLPLLAGPPVGAFTGRWEFRGVRCSTACDRGIEDTEVFNVYLLVQRNNKVCGLWQPPTLNRITTAPVRGLVSVGLLTLQAGEPREDDVAPRFPFVVDSTEQFRLLPGGRAFGSVYSGTDVPIQPGWRRRSLEGWASENGELLESCFRTFR